MSAARALARIELRGLRRAPLRALLIGAAVAVPVAVMTAGAILLHIVVPTPDERVRRAVGDADLCFETAAAATALARLPATATTTALRQWPLKIDIRGLRIQAMAWHAPAASPAAAQIAVIEGRLPTNPREVAISASVAQAAGAGLGDRSDRVGGDAYATVVGRVVDREATTRGIVVVPAAAPVPASHRATWFVDLAAGTDATAVANELRRAGARVRTAAEVRAQPAVDAAVVFVLGSLGYLQAGLVIAGAIAVGLHRRRREIGLLGAAGAERGAILWSILLSTAALATAGSIAGVGAGIGSAALVHPHLDSLNGRLNGSFEVPVGQLWVACVMGVATAALAAALPARAAAAVPIRTALASRRPPREPAHRWLGGGVALLLLAAAAIAAGAWGPESSSASLTIAGSIAGALGLGAFCPWVLEQLARRAGGLPLAWRLAVRDSSRWRHRDGPVVTAVLAGTAMSVTVATAMASLQASPLETWAALRADQIRVRGPAASGVAMEIERALGGLARAKLEWAHTGGAAVHAISGTPARGRPIAIGDAALLRAVGVENSPPAGTRALLAIAGDPVGAHATLHEAHSNRQIAKLPTIDLRPQGAARAPAWILDRATARTLGIEPGPRDDEDGAAWLIRLPRPVSDADVTLARALAQRRPGTAIDVQRALAQQPRRLARATWLLSLFVGLLVIGVATALHAAEARRTRAILHEIGASPRTQRRLAAAQATYLATLGCVLAIPAGLLPIPGLLRALDAPELVLPFGELLAGTAGLPILCWLVRCQTRFSR